MIYKYVIGAIVGGLVGGVVGHFGKCASGTCPLTGSPVGGALFGAVIGILLVSAFGGGQGKFTPSEHVIELEGEEEFGKVLSENELVLVDFTSDRCPPCRRLKPTIHEIATEYAGKVAVVAVNVDRLVGLAQEHGVRGIPNVQIFKAGKLEKNIVGWKPKKTYAGVLDGLLKEPAVAE
jgi:thioredoxin 1